MDRYSLPRLPLLLGAFALSIVLVAADGCSSDPNVEGAKLELRNGDYERVISLTDQALQADPDNAEAYYLRGEAYRRMAETDPDARQENVEMMVQAYTRAYELDPDNDAIQLGMLQAYGAEMNRGAALFGRGAEDAANYTAAASAFGNAAAVMPDSANAYLNQGLALLAGGQAGQAGEPLRAAIDRGADSPEAYLYLGRIYLSEDQAAEALMTLEQGRDAFPDNPDIQTELLNAYGRTGEIDRALDEYAAAVQASPDDPTLRYNYGSFLLQAERYDEAAEQLRRAAELAPDNGNAHYNLGAAYINQVVAVNAELGEMEMDDPNLAAREAERDALLEQAIPSLERARDLLSAEDQDVEAVCESLFRAYSQMRRYDEAQDAAECAGIDLD